MRPRGQTPRMHTGLPTGSRPVSRLFNEAAGADPADAASASTVSVGETVSSMRPRGQTPRMQSAIEEAQAERSLQ